MRLVGKGIKNCAFANNFGDNGIPLGESGIQNPENLGDYIHLMGDHCNSAQGGGISGKIVYRNVYALCRWLH